MLVEMDIITDTIKKNPGKCGWEAIILKELCSCSVSDTLMINAYFSSNSMTTFRHIILHGMEIVYIIYF